MNWMYFTSCVDLWFWGEITASNFAADCWSCKVDPNARQRLKGEVSWGRFLVGWRREWRWRCRGRHWLAGTAGRGARLDGQMRESGDGRPARRHIGRQTSRQSTIHYVTQSHVKMCDSYVGPQCKKKALNFTHKKTCCCGGCYRLPVESLPLCCILIWTVMLLVLYYVPSSVLPGLLDFQQANTRQHIDIIEPHFNLRNLEIMLKFFPLMNETNVCHLPRQQAEFKVSISQFSEPVYDPEWVDSQVRSTAGLMSGWTAGGQV